MFSISDSLERFGRQLREKRIAAGLSQVAAAEAAGVGRSTLIHLERGRKDVRLSNILSVARAVGAEVGLSAASPELLERARARDEEARKLARRREAHLRLALDLALEEAKALRSLREARAQLQSWKANRTCSEHYIREWARILAGSPRQVAARIRRIDEHWIDALFQNTPFPIAPAA